MICWKGGNEEPISLPEIKSATLKKVFEYCEEYKNRDPPTIEKPLKSSNFHELVPAFDAKFMDLEQSEIFDIIMAANYLDIRPLLDLACAKIASSIKGNL